MERSFLYLVQFQNKFSMILLSILLAVLLSVLLTFATVTLRDLSKKVVPSEPTEFTNISASRPASRLSVFIEGLRYRAWLASMRECAILRILLENYDKIPRRSLTFLIVSVFKKFSMMRNLLSKIELRLQRNII